MSDEEGATPTPTPTHDVRIVISSLGNERRTINMNKLDDEAIQKLIQTIKNAFGTVRASSSLLLTGSDGVVTFANLDNVVFVEVHIG